MEISSHSLRERADYIAKAKQAAFLDAVFLMYYYNCDRRRLAGHPKPAEITPGEVFDDYNVAMYEEALIRSRNLLSGSNTVGMAFFQYPSVSISYEEAVEKLRADNPGFSAKSYNITIDTGLRAMR